MTETQQTAAAIFTGIVIAVVLAVYVGALVRFFMWFYGEWRKERDDRRRQAEWVDAQAAAVAAQAAYPLPSQRTSSSASSFGSIDGSGNVRVVGGKRR